MIIWGSKPRTFINNSGSFFCPECNDYKSYLWKKVKRYFTLYFLPVFPMEDLGEYIECETCKSTFKENVLKYDPKERERKIQALYFVAARDIMISIALADGKIENSEINQIIALFEEVTRIILPKEDLLSSIEEIKTSNYDVSKIAKGIAPFLNDQGKETVLRAAIAISKADGVIQDEELDLLHSLADDLYLPKAYANGIFSEEKIAQK